jgi:hypothetical protein
MIDLTKLKDVQLWCVDCGNVFIWTASEQAFYLSKGLSHKKRCKSCLARRRTTLIRESSEEARR